MTVTFPGMLNNYCQGAFLIILCRLYINKMLLHKPKLGNPSKISLSRNTKYKVQQNIYIDVISNFNSRFFISEKSQNSLTFQIGKMMEIILFLQGPQFATVESIFKTGKCFK